MVSSQSALAATLQANNVNVDALRAELSKSRGGSSFHKLFEDEARRLARIVNDQQVVLEISTKSIFRRAHKLATEDIQSVQSSFATLQDLKKETRQSVDECLTLQEFFNHNRGALLSLAQRAEEQDQLVQMGGKGVCSNLIEKHLPRAHINSSLVCVISDTFQGLRQAEQKIVSQSNPDGNALWQAPSSFERTTTKYWVTNENLTKLMLICTAEAPLLVYGKKGPLTSTNPMQLRKSDGDILWEKLATKITSIYFDSAGMDLYKERIKRAEGAQLLRARWYGPTMPKGDKVIFVELKTHHEKWVNNKSVKERALVLERDMEKFLEPVPWTKEDTREMVLRAKPDMKEKDIPKAVDLLHRMHNLVVRHRLTSCVRSVYDRAAFQSSTSNDLRLTLDRHVTLVDERVQRPADSKSTWCLSDSDAEKARASVVPFNVFEIKLANDDDMPAGFVGALNDETLLSAPKFSKFLTGAAAFNAVPTLPYWAAHTSFYKFFDLGARGVPQPSATASGDYAMLGAKSDELDTMTLPDGVVIAPRKLPRIEPKTFFANERTFVQWINASTLLLSVASLVMNAGDFRKTASVIAFSAFGLMMYSTKIYFERLYKLKERHATGYFDRVKPIVLTAVVTLAVALVWLDSIKGSDFLTLKDASDSRRLRGSLNQGNRVLQQEAILCPFEVGRMNIPPQQMVGSVVMDPSRNSFLMTSGDSLYMQSVQHDELSGTTDSTNRLLKLPTSQLQGIVAVEDRLFAVSDGPHVTELIELTWWGNSAEQHLRVVGRWHLAEVGTQVSAVDYIPSMNDESQTGALYIHMNDRVNVYSIPSATQDDGLKDRPVMLKSLNMKVLHHGVSVAAAGSHGGGVELPWTMHSFEGATYIFKPSQALLEVWNLTEGELFSTIALPATSSTTAWTDFALERRRDAGMEGETDGLILHLMDTSNNLIWSFPASEDHNSLPPSTFSVPNCQAPVPDNN